MIRRAKKDYYGFTEEDAMTRGGKIAHVRFLNILKQKRMITWMWAEGRVTYLSVIAVTIKFINKI